MSANIQGLIEQGQRALQAGNKDEAQQFLIRATELEEKNEDAWLWLAAAVESEDEQRICLDNVLVLNPDNEQARQMLAEIDRNSGVVDNFDSLADVANALGTEEYPAVAEDISAEDDLDSGPFSSASFMVESDEEEVNESSSFEESFRQSVGDIEPESSNYESLMEAPDTDDVSQELDAIDAGSAEDETVYEDELTAVQDDGFSGGFESSPGYDAAAPTFGGFADDAEDDIDPLSLLSPDVKPTRLPGTDMSPNSGGLAGVIVMAVLNLLAVGLLLFQWLA